MVKSFLATPSTIEVLASDAEKGQESPQVTPSRPTGGRLIARSLSMPRLRSRGMSEEAKTNPESKQEEETPRPLVDDDHTSPSPRPPSGGRSLTRTLSMPRKLKTNPELHTVTGQEAPPLMSNEQSSASPRPPSGGRSLTRTLSMSRMLRSNPEHITGQEEKPPDLSNEQSSASLSSPSSGRSLMRTLSMSRMLRSRSSSGDYPFFSASAGKDAGPTPPPPPPPMMSRESATKGADSAALARARVGRGLQGGIGVEFQNQVGGEWPAGSWDPVVVYQLFENSPAGSTELEVGDIVISVNGTPVATGANGEDVLALIHGPLEEKVRIEVQRGMEIVTRDILIRRSPQF
mmetsp:Transcript_75976/g.150528  ORF Transcript_75976/g.150528 Transcript_75976/m.150528 type:complete len:347 (-) Transcript_75976:16-1056(-)